MSTEIGRKLGIRTRRERHPSSPNMMHNFICASSCSIVWVKSANITWYIILDIIRFATVQYAILITGVFLRDTQRSHLARSAEFLVVFV